MKALLQHAAKARALVEDDDLPVSPDKKLALIRLIEFVILSCPEEAEKPAPVGRGQHTIYVHPNNRCRITFEPDDLRAPYYEWRLVFGSWALYGRHCWRAVALQMAGDRISSSVVRLAPHSSRPPPADAVRPRPPSIEIMPLEEQIRQLLLAEKDAGGFDGTYAMAEICAAVAGFDVSEASVKDALSKVVRGIPHEDPERDQATGT